MRHLPQNSRTHIHKAFHTTIYRVNRIIYKHSMSMTISAPAAACRLCSLSLAIGSHAPISRHRRVRPYSRREFEFEQHLFARICSHSVRVFHQHFSRDCVCVCVASMIEQYQYSSVMRDRQWMGVICSSIVPVFLKQPAHVFLQFRRCSCSTYFLVRARVVCVCLLNVCARGYF